LIRFSEKTYQLGIVPGLVLVLAAIFIKNCKPYQLGTYQLGHEYHGGVKKVSKINIPREGILGQISPKNMIA